MSGAPRASDGTELSPLKRALLAIERLQDRVEQLEGARREPLAVVGMGCRFPAGDGPDAYFEALRAGVDAVRSRPPVPRTGWRASEDPGEFPFPPAGYLPDDVALFDPGFFGISPREAASIDPQQRLLLEVAWEAFEHGGIDPRGLEGTRTGVFVGMAGNDYATLQLTSERALELLNPHFTSGIGQSMASGRIAYLLGLQGPALTVDTACSSSLVALHLACQSLRAGESDLALAAGTNLILSDDFTRAFGASRMLAPDGRCKTFDAAADGFGRGEGCGVVLLKRLSDARRDGDRIFALVRGTAVNQDGPSSGLTAPNGPAQESVLRAALASAGLTPAQVGYVEAHGTGTALGDPIEMQALGAVFGSEAREAPLQVGSVKTNMGHLEAAAGIAGFIKAVQTVRSGWIPPHLHFSEPSPHIPWKELDLQVPTGAAPLPRTGGRRRAGVSSFGFSGTNAHVVVEEPPEPGDEGAAAPARVAPERPLHLLTLSAPGESGLRDAVRRHAAHLAAGAEAPLADVAHTANAGRAHHAHRLAVTAADAPAARAALEAWLSGTATPAVRTGRLHTPDRPPVAFLFTGQGSQYPGMGWALRESSPAFRRALDRCADLLAGELEVPLLELLDPAGRHGDRIHRTDHTQPALFAIQYALCEMWAAWGIRPDVVVGHSIGEYAAAHLAGAFSLEDALRLVTARGRLMQAVEPAGRMLAVMAPEERVAPWVSEAGSRLSVAAVNAPGQTVVSGEEEAVAALAARAAAAGVETRTLRTSHAFHSPLMDPAVEGLRAVLDDIAPAPARTVRFVSSVTGRLAAPAEVADRDYWARQLREPVRFADAAAAVASVAAVAVEIGPHPALRGLVGQGDADLAVHPSLHRERPPWTTLLDTMAALYVDGVTPSWTGFEEGRSRRRVDLPRHPFQRTRLWVDLGSGRRGEEEGAHPLLGRRRGRPGPGREFQGTLRADAPAFIDEHRVLGRPILPGTAFLEMALSAGRAALGCPVAVDGMDLMAAMDFSGGPRRVHVETEPDGTERARVAIHSAPAPADDDTVWTLHATGTVVAATAEGADLDLDAVRHRLAERIEGGAFYDDLAARGYTFGPRLQGVREVWRGPDEALARIGLPDACDGDRAGYLIHPLLLDAALQAVGPALGDEAPPRTYLPVWVERLQLSGGNAADVAWAHVRVTERTGASRTADVHLVDERGRGVARLRGVTFRAVTGASLAAEPGEPLYHVRWVPEPAADPAPTASVEVRRRVADRLRSVLARQAESEGAAAYDGFVDRLEAESAAWIFRALDELGWRAEPGAKVSLAEVARELDVVPARHRLLARCLAVLEEEGVLEANDAGWSVRAPLPPVRTPSAPTADARPEAVLLHRCGPHLAEALQGRGDPLELLFPGGDATVAEAMYHDAPPARIFNRAVAEALGVALDAAAGRPLRVLEVGAGTGGTTRRVLDHLEARAGTGTEVEYTFTDVSPLFVDRARRRHGESAGARMSFRTLDLDLPLDEQGFAAGGYDVVVAANCLHAARDLAAAVAGVGRLLRPGGLLLAVEVFEPHRWFDLTVGLTDGWWHFTDPGLRGAYPCVSPERWHGVLRGAGLVDADALRLSQVAEADGRASRGQGVVVAARGESAPVRPDGPWLIVADGTGVADELRQAVREAGAEALTVASGDAAVAEGLAAALAAHERWAGIVHCAGIAGDREPTPDALGRRLRHGGESLLAAARVATGGAVQVDALVLVTRGGQAVDPHDADVDPAAAALWGMMRSVGLEAPALQRRSLDLDPTTPFDAAGAARWLLGESPEPEAAVRGGRFRVRRLLPGAPEPDGAATLPVDYRLPRPTTGALEDLTFTPGRRTPPGRGQVEIRVAASALNFKDVLNVLGMYPGDAGPLGSECSGVVSAVGEGVRMRVGTPVVAAAGHAYGKHVVADASLVAPLPAGLSFVQGATLPVAYLTAAFALDHLAGLGPGDRVLIHAAAGGVGTAACALARRAGATVFATAGTEAKRELLRSRGIDHVYDSRSGAFADGILADTGGRGVDVVLNSLADELVERSFAVIAPGGRFLEIGKRGIWSPERVAALGRAIDYHVIDWGATHRTDPERVGGVFRAVMEAVAAGALPPLPASCFALDRVQDAFRHMAQARHVGKVILTHPVVSPGRPPRFDAEGTWLITGGLSGLGLETAAWAARQGAGTLVLVGRRDPGPDAAARIDALRNEGVDVHTRRCDVGDAGQVRELTRWMRATLPPLRGIVHSAGTLADRTLAQLQWADVEAVLAAKVHGPALLAEATREAPPEFVLAYSSIAGTLGSPGQANHAAANTALDALCATAWRTGSDAMSIAWGPWAETGAATDRGTLERTSALGLGALTTAEGLAVLDRAAARPVPFAVAVRIDDPAALRSRRPDPLFDELAAVPGGDAPTPASSPGDGDTGSLTALLDDTPAEGRRRVVMRRVRERVRTVLGLGPEVQIEAERPLGEFGLDSLLAVELRNILGTDARQRLPATLLFDHPTVAALADHLLERLAPEGGDGAAEPAPGAADPLAALDDLDALSDDDVERLLAEKMKDEG